MTMTVDSSADAFRLRMKRLSEKARIRTRSITVGQLRDHFEQRELARDNTWGSHGTKKTYQAYLNRWVRPHWRQYELSEFRTIQVESRIRCLPLAKSSCAKIRNLMSVLFNHACRYELYDRNPIHLVFAVGKFVGKNSPTHRNGCHRFADPIRSATSALRVRRCHPAGNGLPSPGASCGTDERANQTWYRSPR